jgi:hypothetical protein
MTALVFRGYYNYSIKDEIANALASFQEQKTSLNICNLEIIN